MTDAMRTPEEVLADLIKRGWFLLRVTRGWPNQNNAQEVAEAVVEALREEGFRLVKDIEND